MIGKEHDFLYHMTATYLFTLTEFKALKWKIPNLEAVDEMDIRNCTVFEGRPNTWYLVPRHDRIDPNILNCVYTGMDLEGDWWIDELGQRWYVICGVKVLEDMHYNTSPLPIESIKWEE